MSLAGRLRSEFNNSIKSRDTEEKLDLVFYRPIGFIIAKIAKRLSMNPSQLSLLGLITGVLAAILFAKYDNSTSVLIFASAMFLLSGIFDSSDGQLARIAGNGSKIGLVIDGLCDAGVTIAIYVGVFWEQISSNILWAIPILISVLAHSFQCAILDFYHREYLFFGCGITNKDYWNPTIEEMDASISESSGWEKIINKLRRNWVKQQTLLSTRETAVRLLMQKTINESDSRKESLTTTYRQLNLKMLTYWRLIGTNAHTIVIITLVLLHARMGLMVFDIIVFNLIIFLVRDIQRSRDLQLLEQLKLKV